MQETRITGSKMDPLTAGQEFIRFFMFIITLNVRF